jgi:hypothetical protein
VGRGLTVETASRRNPARPASLGRHRRASYEPGAVQSAINVAQPRPVTGFCDRHRDGTSARLRPRLHHRPAATPPSRRAQAHRLLPGVHRDRQRRPNGPPRPRPVLDQSSTSSAPATPWWSGSWIDSAGPYATWSRPSPAWPSVESGTARLGVATEPGADVGRLREGRPQP